MFLRSYYLSGSLGTKCRPSSLEPNSNYVDKLRRAQSYWLVILSSNRHPQSNACGGPASFTCLLRPTPCFCLEDSSVEALIQCPP